MERIIERIIQGKPIVKGEAQANALVSNEPISFWGGYDQNTGEIIDRRHPLSGEMAAGRILAIPFTRGSSTSSAVLLESVRAGTAPAAILTTEPDHFCALASIVADEMYQKPIPLVALTKKDFATLQSGQWLHVHADGKVVIRESW